MFFSNFYYFLSFSVNFEQFRVPSGVPGLHFSMFFSGPISYRIFFTPESLWQGLTLESWAVDLKRLASWNDAADLVASLMPPTPS